MRNLLAPLITIAVIAILPRLLNRTPYFKRPDVQARRTAKANLPEWVKIYYIFSFLVFWLLISFIFFKLAAFVYGLIHPGVSFIVNQSLNPSTLSDALNGVRIIFILILGFPLGMMLSNLIAHSIPTMRKIESHASEGIPGTSFKEANAGLWKIGRIIVFAALVTVVATMFF